MRFKGFFIQILIKKNLSAYSEDSDHTLQLAASDLGLHCLAMTNKKDVRLIFASDMGLLLYFT